jgi:hypothetical protein
VIAADVSPHALARLTAIVDRALERSGALGVRPTPLEALRRHAGIELVEHGGLPEEVLGALWFEERLMYVRSGQSTPRRTFTEAHELVHALCPWHRAVLRRDTEAELFRPVRDAIEAEANAGAAMLLFQGSAFAGLAAAEPPSLAAVRALAEAHGASLHATLHHYTQSRPDAVAMLTAGRFPRKDRSLPVWRCVESGAFRERFGPAAALAPGGLAPGSALRDLAEAARTAGDAPAIAVGRGARRLRAEAHYNRHAFLVLVAADPERPARPRTGPRAQAVLACA